MARGRQGPHRVWVPPGGGWCQADPRSFAKSRRSGGRVSPRLMSTPGAAKP